MGREMVGLGKAMGERRHADVLVNNCSQDSPGSEIHLKRFLRQCVPQANFHNF